MVAHLKSNLLHVLDANSGPHVWEIYDGSGEDFSFMNFLGNVFGKPVISIKIKLEGIQRKVSFQFDCTLIRNTNTKLFAHGKIVLKYTYYLVVFYIFTYLERLNVLNI